MNKNPIVNEPGYETLTIENSPVARKYIKLLEFHNHLIAVLQMVNEIPSGFECFKELIESKFCELYKENIKFLNEKAQSSDNDTNVYLRMYSLQDKLSYKYLVEQYTKAYSKLSVIYGDAENSLNSSKEITDAGNSNQENSESKDTSNSVPVTKKKGPSINAGDFDIGYETSANDRLYVVKQVNGKGGNTYKRWVLKK